MNFNQAFFIKSASRLGQCPEDTGAEIAFAGRSNAGKSSLINTLTNQNKLAKTSKTPGRTQLLNFFGLNELLSERLVDLPGYGYAQVAKTTKEEWAMMIENYLINRQSLKAVVLIADCRHPLQPFDLDMIDWAVNTQKRMHIVLTKSDKLKRGPANSALQKVLNQYDIFDFVTAQLFSATKKQGLDELQAVLSEVF
ncbi:MAG: ribosome biogenesis GTP-binding protein YihA/YsxC [Gammaproteobacteria bacterium]